jgi:low temperature requirement protein LtrA
LQANSELIQTRDNTTKKKVKISHSLRVNNLMLKSEIVKKNSNFIKKIETTVVNLTNLLLEIWDRNNSSKRKMQQTMKKLMA